MKGSSIVYRFLFSILAVSFLFAPISSMAQTGYMPAKHGGQYPEYPTINYGTGEKAEQIKRGEYLTKAGDCIACHTEPNGVPFAGGYPIKTPFGTIYAPNLTADKKYGLGAWTDAQFIKAMREGINPKGHYYYPAFPYLFFNRVNDEDLKAIKAYLDALPPVAQPNKKNELMFPFNWRFLQLGWRLLFFTFEKPGVYKTDPQKSAAWNRGAYLVQGLGHCSMCHTPSWYMISKNYPLAAPINKYYLAGAMVEGFFAPNITSVLIGKASHQELSDVFKRDLLIGGGQVQGPMLEVDHDSLKYLTDNDIYAIYSYLKEVKTQEPKREGGSNAGKAVYTQYCAGCHATGAGGAPKLGDVTEWAPRIKLGMDKLYSNAIKGIGAMPPKGTCLTCTDNDIKQAVDYIIAESKPGVGTESAPQAKPVKQLTVQDGEKIYNKYCSVCHAPNSNYLNTPKLGDKDAWKPLIKKGVDVLYVNTIHGIGDMPAKGACRSCSDAQIKAALLYMLEKSKTSGNYTLW